MKRLEKLKFERQVASKLTLLPIQMKPIIEQYYDREIMAIEKYGGENPVVSHDSLSEIEKIMEEVYGDKEA